ncbi:hypothetical protein [Azospirillum sp. TSO22-1]|uniref:hypothetical protein n=1 Tax=Azospirillum sp. TSO22-1 TaxID=716789 RepID=UPI000D60BCFA|nr:hypothetical protein [Azospirillum sp. TSO22-1]PWC42132.1 hypothetical protein TSO221_22390 [Azospirillum sp. TSO22-1]
MRAGFLTVDITPARPAPLAGFAARTRAFTGIDAPLEANLAGFVDGGGQRVVLASLDTLFVGAATHAAIAAAAGLAPERLVLVATHTHNAPSLAPEVPQLGALDPAYRDMVVRCVADAIRRLPAEPVSAGAAERLAPYNVNRRKPAWVLDYPALRHERRLRFGREIALAPYRKGIVDRTLRCIVLRDDAGAVRAVVWSFACHANRYPRMDRVSPDFPGLVRGHLRARFGAGCAVLYLPGFAGSAIADIPVPVPRTVNEVLRIALPFNPYIPWFTPDGFRAWGDRLAATAVACAEAARPAEADLEHRHLRSAPIFHGTPEIALDMVSLDFGPACGIVAMTGEVIGEWGPILAPRLPPGRIATGYLAGPCLYVPTDAAVRAGGYEADRFRTLFDLDGTFIPDLDRTVGRAVAELLADRPGAADLQPARQERLA